MTDKQTLILIVCGIAVLVALVLIARTRSGPRVTIVNTSRDNDGEKVD